MSRSFILPLAECLLLSKPGSTACKQGSSVLTAAPGNGARGRHVAGCSEFHFYKGSFQKEKKETALGELISSSVLKSHRKQQWPSTQSRNCGLDSRAMFYTSDTELQTHTVHPWLENIKSGLLDFEEVKKLLSHQLTGISGSPDLQRIFSRFVLSGYCSAACSNQERKTQLVKSGRVRFVAFLFLDAHLKILSPCVTGFKI